MINCPGRDLYPSPRLKLKPLYQIRYRVQIRWTQFTYTTCFSLWHLVCYLKHLNRRNRRKKRVRFNYVGRIRPGYLSREFAHHCQKRVPWMNFVILFFRIIQFYERCQLNPISWVKPLHRYIYIELKRLQTVWFLSKRNDNSIKMKHLLYLKKLFESC